MSGKSPPWPPSARDLRVVFDTSSDLVVGLEDEVMLLAPDTLELSHSAAEMLALLDGDKRFKLELPASQLEITTAPTAQVVEATSALSAARHELVEKLGGRVQLAAAGVHPFSSGRGELNQTPRYEQTVRDYTPSAQRQLVCAFQIHVSVGGAERALAIYNAARSYLPLLAALAANAPFYEGSDTGLASVRPKLGELLPRQGVPPLLESWDAYAEAFRWGAASGAFADGRRWWWELRPHPYYGTLEFRVPDAQSSVPDATAIASVTQALVACLCHRYDAGERLAVHPSWRIAENRWSACREGVEGEMADLDSGRMRPTRSVLEELLGKLASFSRQLNAQRGFARAREMVAVNGAIAQRRIAADGGPHAIAQWLVGRFLASND